MPVFDPRHLRQDFDPHHPLTHEPTLSTLKVVGYFPKIYNKTKKPKYFFVKKQKQKTKWQINNLIFEQLVAMNSFFNI